MVTKSSWYKVHAEPDATFLFHFATFHFIFKWKKSSVVLVVVLIIFIYFYSIVSTFWPTIISNVAQVFDALLSVLTSVQASKLLQTLKKKVNTVHTTTIHLAGKSAYTSACMQNEKKKKKKCKTKNLTMYNSKCTSADRA